MRAPLRLALPPYRVVQFPVAYWPRARADVADAGRDVGGSRRSTTCSTLFRPRAHLRFIASSCRATWQRDDPVDILGSRPGLPRATLPRE